ncbi:MAG: aminotransferase class I/II-fold pyridoxal phosphate-dependent enzyme, partial [Proteobacteria bacterium]|nr:aminotransferase class I/II-fold pyridoxal phosphate-dependent enzyme [Pseudomonadota bacterium]
ERAVAECVGRAHAVATVNGTAALHVTLVGLGVGPGDVVLVPALTFIAPINAVLYRGAEVRFLDCQADTLGLDPAAVSNYLSSRTSRGQDGFCRETGAGRRVACCLPVHVCGHPVDVDPILLACGEHGVPVVEDASEALGSQYKGRPAGGLGLAGTFSFNGNKIVTGGGGGAVVTDDEALARRLRHLTTQAKSDPLLSRHDEVGFNYRLPNLNAAVALAGIERLEELVRAKRAVGRWYREELAGVAGVDLFQETAWARSNQWLQVVFVAPDRRDRIINRLRGEGIQVRPLWFPCHRQTTMGLIDPPDLPVTEDLVSRGINLPSSPHLSRSDVARVAAGLRRALREVGGGGPGGTQ